MFIILLTGSLPHHRGARLSVGSGGQILSPQPGLPNYGNARSMKHRLFFNRRCVRAVKKPQFHCTDTDTPLIHR
jgi:hypothetical protein